MTAQKVLILGGYGNFGKRIAEKLSVVSTSTLIIAGRNLRRAEQLCIELTRNGSNAALEPVAIDIHSPAFKTELKSLAPDIVIHTGGPFQAQDYKVPEACIAIGSHYIDLADDRRFVCDIDILDEQAKENDVLVVSGASSVPGLSSTVVDGFLDQFSRLDEIDFAIAPGNKSERGEATVRGILSYTGHPFPVFYKGAWIKRYGWMSPRKLDFGNTIGKRWLANIDIPDLEIFPKRYDSAQTVTFQAGLELPFLHLGMVTMAALAKIGLVKDWSVLTKFIFNASEVFNNLGTDIGGMHIRLIGLNHDQKYTSVKWTLCAENGTGPYIPTISAIILAKKLLAGTITLRGATPCLGLYTLHEFDEEVTSLEIQHQTEISVG